jgi:hypothetical protein
MSLRNENDTRQTAIGYPSVRERKKRATAPLNARLRRVAFGSRITHEEDDEHDRNDVPRRLVREQTGRGPHEQGQSW